MSYISKRNIFEMVHCFGMSMFSSFHTNLTSTTAKHNILNLSMHDANKNVVFDDSDSKITSFRNTLKLKNVNKTRFAMDKKDEIKLLLMFQRISCETLKFILMSIFVNI